MAFFETLIGDPVNHSREPPELAEANQPEAIAEILDPDVVNWEAKSLPYAGPTVDARLWQACCVSCSTHLAGHREPHCDPSGGTCRTRRRW
jgi:hypothetical protein